MRQVLLTVPDEFYAPFMKLVKALPFSIKAKPVTPPKPKQYTPAQQEWIEDFREVLHEVELHQQGKIKLKTLDELIDELQNNQLD